MALLVIGTPAFPAEKSAPSQAELKRIQAELRGVKKKAKEAGRKEKSVQAELARIDRNLGKKRAEVKRLELRMNEVGREMDATRVEMDGYRVKFRVKEADLARRLREMYKANRAGGQWVVLASGNYDSILKRYKYLSVISHRDKRLMEGYEGDIHELASYTDRLRGQHESFNRIKEARDAEAGRVLADEEEKKKLLASIRQKKKGYEAMARDLEEQGRRMQQLIRRLDEESKARGRPELPKNIPPLGAGLDWPVGGKVVSHFGKQKHPVYDTYVFKKGIEIQAALGSEVRAVEAAEVVFANFFKGLGLVAILRHGGDLYSVYAHLSGLKVKTGEKVARGQVIATLGSSGPSEGPALYFEVRKGAEAQDPMRWLKKR
ncbi:MAG TPA: peptidoglycan DD-metalloendopeptidase family protein [Nitrospirota bacterium]|nr:peptidoglycan DD-metalloendopeptidase family protein [Nitrospirota bacterium]